MTEDLYTTADTKRVRELLYKEQAGLCKLSKVAVALKDCHLDHKHDDQQLVRGVLYKQSNMGLGKLEGLWTRYLAYWYPGTLSEFLRASADYLEQSEEQPDTRFRHNHWMKKLKTKFNALNAKQMDEVLISLGSSKGNNATSRKQLFSKLVLDRSLGYDTILSAINKAKEL